MNETELRESLAQLVSEGSPYELNVAASLRTFRAQRRRKVGVAWATGIISVAAVVGVALAVPALRPAPLNRSHAALSPAAGAPSDTHAVTALRPAPASQSNAALSASDNAQEAPPDAKPKVETTFEDAAKTAIMSAIRSASPPAWKLNLFDDFPPRAGRGWEGWHVTGTADDGQGRSQLGVGVQVGTMKYFKAEDAKAGMPHLQPGTCPSQLPAAVTCTATPQPDGRVLLVIHDADRAAETGRITNSVVLVDVTGDVLIGANSENYARPGITLETPDIDRARHATRTNPIYSIEQLTQLVLDLARNVQPHLADVAGTP